VVEGGRGAAAVVAEVREWAAWVVAAWAVVA
jgi:hypothetical protein